MYDWCTIGVTSWVEIKKGMLMKKEVVNVKKQLQLLYKTVYVNETYTPEAKGVRK